MSKVIKNGTIVTHDRTYKADVLVENGVIAEIGPDLKGDETLDASGCYVMPGGIDPHTHLEMPFMGTYSSDDYESGTRAALHGGTTMVIDDEYLRESLINPLKHIAEGYTPIMPSYEPVLKDEDIEHLIAYIKTLK